MSVEDCFILVKITPLPFCYFPFFTSNLKRALHPITLFCFEFSYLTHGSPSYLIVWFSWFLENPCFMNLINL
jgi:hypothetical protein